MRRPSPVTLPLTTAPRSGRTPGRPVRVATIGVGSLGQHHARILAGLREAEFVAVVDRDAARAREVGARHRVVPLTDYRDLPDDLEAVSVAVPTTAHAEVV